jgi:hypothetical protein
MPWPETPSTSMRVTSDKVSRRSRGQQRQFVGDCPLHRSGKRAVHQSHASPVGNRCTVVGSGRKVRGQSGRKPSPVAKPRSVPSGGQPIHPARAGRIAPIPEQVSYARALSRRHICWVFAVHSLTARCPVTVPRGAPSVLIGVGLKSARLPGLSRLVVGVSCRVR